MLPTAPQLQYVSATASPPPPPPAPPPYTNTMYPNIRYLIKSTKKQYKKLLIPGIGGSKIYCMCGLKKTKLYPSPIPGLKSLNRHFYECDNVSTKPLKKIYGISVYKNFLARTRAQCYSYDWRQPAIEHAKQLYSHLIDEYDGDKLVLIGHSLGGLIIRILIEYLKPPDLLEKIDQVFICGTPFFGSHDTNDYNCEVQILPVILQTKRHIQMQNKPVIITKNDIKQIFRHFGKTLLYLAPSFVIEKMYPENYIDENGDIKLGHYTSILLDELIEMRNVHDALSKYEFHMQIEYNFFFNVSRKIDVTHTMDKNLMKHISRKDGETHIKRVKPQNKIWEVTRTFDSDGLILSCRKMPINANIWFDHTLATHSLLMNSRQLSNIID